MQKPQLRVCENGQPWGIETISNGIRGDKVEGPPHCPDCGKPTLTECPECESPLRATSNQNDLEWLKEDDITGFCQQCGEAFPWTDPISAHKTREGDFVDLDISGIEGGYYYRSLINEVNLAYQVRANNAMNVLFRNLLENLVYDSLYGYFGHENIDLYFNKEEGKRLPFSVLLENFKNRQSEFSMVLPDVDSDLIDKIVKFKNQGDSSAHTAEDLRTDEDVKEMQENATTTVRILLELRSRVMDGV